MYSKAASSHHAKDAETENLNAMQIVKRISDGRKKKQLSRKKSMRTSWNTTPAHMDSSQGRHSVTRGKANGRKKKKRDTGN